MDFPESEHRALSHLVVLCLTEDHVGSQYWDFLDPYQQRLNLTLHTFSRSPHGMDFPESEHWALTHLVLCLPEDQFGSQTGAFLIPINRD